MKHKQRGVTLMELLVVVAIIGIITAVAIWNYFIAIERGKAKKSVADMRAIGTAWESRETDTGRYNAAGALFTWPPTTMTHAEVLANLSPTWIRNVPQKDGWGRPFDFGLDQGFGGSPATLYAIRSRCRDGAIDANYDQTPTEEFDCDIIFSNGAFVIIPEKVD